MRLLAFAALVFGFLGMAGSFATADQLRRQKVIPVQASPAPPVEKLGDGSIREKILIRVVRSRVCDALVKDGLNGKTYTRAEAEAVFDSLGDDVIKGAVREASPKAWEAIGEGGFLAKLIQWIKDHPEEVAAIIKLILSLLALLDPEEVAFLLSLLSII